MKYNKVSVHWLVFAGCSGVMIGLLLAKFGLGPISTLSIAGLITLPMLIKLRLTAIIPVLAISLSLGLWRGQHIEQQLTAASGQIGQKVRLTGRVSTDPVYHESGQLEFRITAAELEGAAFPGNIRIRGYVPDVLRGDIIRAEGKLYDGFGPLSGSLSYGQIDIIERSASPLENLRRQFMAGINSSMVDPESSLGLGFLLGTRSILPESMTAALSATGLTHIVAVSGYNLTIIVNLMRQLFLKRSRFLSLAASIGFLFSFIALAGSSPSVNRAAVVSVLSLLGWYFGRKAHALVLLWLSAAITAYWQPLYLWSDIGWYLSFCAFFGVLILAPLVSAKLFKNRRPGLLGSILVETTMAQAVTLPLIVLIFKDVSVISLLANMLILPLIPISMLLTFVAGLGVLLLPGLAGWLAWPAQLLLSYMVNLISLLARLPWAELPVTISAEQFVITWLVILLLWRGLAKFSQTKRQLTDGYPT